ncbi:hypothetical protein D9611_010039 [Ephemerocybe angulata]|uniref:Uncharacterized protein n=1 Tax=Ephemerocybe angulata TaxID=980116 RepID=A0A8H5FFY6_9AGAR|nr:hypothetical protein D9611_010039 [Tulosesus angulatus]
MSSDAVPPLEPSVANRGTRPSTAPASFLSFPDLLVPPFDAIRAAAPHFITSAPHRPPVLQKDAALCAIYSARRHRTICPSPNSHPSRTQPARPSDGDTL